jgi:hypothetical protein
MPQKQNEFDAITGEFNNMVYESLGTFGKYETAIVRYKSEYLKYILSNSPPPPPMKAKRGILVF